MSIDIDQWVIENEMPDENTNDLITTYDCMTMKTECLIALDISDRLMGLYCPVIPPKNTYEVLSIRWVHYFFNKLYLYIDDIRDGLDENCDFTIFCYFCIARNLCPYCIANTNVDRTILDCTNCSYKKLYGACAINNGGAWSRARKYALNKPIELMILDNDIIYKIESIKKKYI